MGQFNLVGIPPAPRGVPQVEVTFDIDADGIVNVSASDKATGKDQSITLAAQSGLSDAEIESMVSQAEKHAESDKKRRDVIEACNHAESIINDTEKAMNDYKDQLDKEEEGKIREKIKEVRDYIAQGHDNLEAETVKEKYADLQQGSLKLFELVYKKKAAEAASTSGSSSSTSEQEPVDAEFKDAKKKE